MPLIKTRYSAVELLRRINELTKKLNELVESHNALLSKLDASDDLLETDFVELLEAEEVVK